MLIKKFDEMCFFARKASQKQKQDYITEALYSLACEIEGIAHILELKGEHVLGGKAKRIRKDLENLNDIIVNGKNGLRKN